MYLYRLNEATLNKMKIKAESLANSDLKNSALLHMGKSSGYGVICIYISYIHIFKNG